MASGGSSGRPASSSRSFDFGSDDVLCSYDDFAAQDVPNGRRSDPSIKDYHDGRMGRPLVNIYEQDDFSKEGIINSVEKCMKKYADNLLRFLEGLSGRLSQLEVHCYKLERTVGEFRSDVIRDNTEVDQKLKSLDKHVQEVHRSIQILRDKQELLETQKELAKLQMVQKESTPNETVIQQSVSDTKKLDDKQDVTRQQLALVPSHQTIAPPSLPVRPEQIQPYKEQSIQHQAPAATTVQQDQYTTNQSGTYFDQRQTFPQDRQSQIVHPQVQYVQPRSQLQDIPAQLPQQPQIVTQNQAPPVPQYQQQWPQQSPQQFTQQILQQQQSASQTQMRPQTPPYPPYPSQPATPSPETYTGSMPMQVPYSTAVAQSNANRPESVPFGFGTGSTVPLPSINRSEAAGYGFGGAGSSVSQPTQHPNAQRQMQPPTSQTSFGPQQSKVPYAGNAPYPPAYNTQGGYGNTYGYQPSNPQQVSPGNTSGLHSSSMLRNHPFGDMIEKAVGMGYGRDQVASAIQRMADSGQPIDFNVLLDRLNGSAAGGNPRGW